MPLHKDVTNGHSTMSGAASSTAASSPGDVHEVGAAIRPALGEAPDLFPDVGCAQCEKGVRIEPLGSLAHAEVCSCARDCPICKGGRYRFTKDARGYEHAQMCTCERLRIRVRMYNEARLPAKYFDARLEENFRDAHNASTFDTLRSLSRIFQRGQHGLVLMGPAGVGKTWLVCAFVQHLIFSRGAPVLFRDFFQLLHELKAGYSQDRPEAELLSPLTEVRVLVVDELGKGRNTSWELNILDSIISQRYNANRTTIFTSNYTLSRSTTMAERLRSREALPSEETPWLRETLPERIGSRIYSRLQEMCDFISLSGPDRRNQDALLEGAAPAGVR